MTGYSRSPRTLRAGIVMLDPASFKPARIVVLQYTPDQLTRSLQVQAASADGGDRSEPLRLKGPPVETFKLEAEIDATDQLEFPDDAANKAAAEVGIFPQLAMLESLVSPASAQVDASERLLMSGAIEIAPMEAPIALFVWSAQRVVPVRATEFGITEEAFDAALNPIRARVSLGLRVLSTNDFGLGHRGAAFFMGYLRNKEALAGRAAQGSLELFGLKGV